jgi:hypothetical protein
MAGLFDDIPYSYDPHGFIVAATQPMQPRAGAVAPAQNPLAMARGGLASGPAYQALMSALLGSFNQQPNIQMMERNNAGIPASYTPLGIPRSQRINWTSLPGMPGTVQPMQQPAPQPAQPASLLPPPQSFTE